MTYPNGEWRNTDGAPTKENEVKSYIQNNPNSTVSEVAKKLGVSRTTVYKYKKDLN
ncbi:helix-turn-helix domain-containing protein [Staphylococcus aureus]|uniref:helix-turn-helix domain-containing protein n=1 Tax=Staphylococcus aureus TaxID=1280 RepID=UPI001CD07937